MGLANLNNFKNNMFNFKKILTFALSAWSLLEEPLAHNREWEERERGRERRKMGNRAGRASPK